MAYVQPFVVPALMIAAALVPLVLMLAWSLEPQPTLSERIQAARR